MARLWVCAAAAVFFVFAAACKKPEPKTRGPGDTLKSFIVKNCETGEKYCQVCAFAGKPIILAVGGIGDEVFERGLARIQRIVEANAAKGLKAFAVAGEVKEGRIASFVDEAPAMRELVEMRRRLEIAFPVTILPKQLDESEGRSYAGFNDAYEVAGLPAVFLADAENRVVYAGVMRSRDAERELKALEDAIAKAL